MTAHFAQFQALHAQSTPLLLPNAWDAASTVLLQTDGAPAIATSSAALAWSLGYADGGALPTDELLAAIRRIVRVATVPISVDLEDGYSADPRAVADLVLQVARCGAVGINLEDGASPAALLADKIAACRKALSGTPLFINARTDVYLKGLVKSLAKPADGQDSDNHHAIALCAERLQLYQAAGASGAFVPGMASAADAARLVAQIKLPLNLMAVPSLAPASQLAAAGVKRISVGGSLFQTTYGYARSKAQQFMASGEVAGLFEYPLVYGAMNSSMNSALSAKN
jgi:2-methylisocitrate lyase-like PEP mutase family enzyme